MNYTTEHFTNSNAFNKNYPVRNKNVCIEFNKLSTGKISKNVILKLKQIKLKILL